MRRWTTGLLKACGWATSSSTPCSVCARSNCVKWCLSLIPSISTTFCLSYVPRISLTVLTFLPMAFARCTRRMSTRCNTCQSVRVCAFALQLLGITPDSGAQDADSGENSGELDTGEPDAVDQDKESPSTAHHKVLLGPKGYKRLKHGKDVPFDAELQYLKPQLLAQTLVHHEWTCLTISGSTRRQGRQHPVVSWPMMMPFNCSCRNKKML
jgi:hypothetical protein